MLASLFLTKLLEFLLLDIGSFVELLATSFLGETLPLLPNLLPEQIHRNVSLIESPPRIGFHRRLIVKKRGDAKMEGELLQGCTCKIGVFA
ncbi:hypothetical protein F2Q68_00042835 [Brassica cretica]|uniref:Uncharacterized protein n=1 Tax=Brassica cretica TaxID=69181 RepID=A0A8S9MVC9_BRACR|nr:hypothetical protein F2Q68_00042835 [Brassica cretica]